MKQFQNIFIFFLSCGHFLFGAGIARGDCEAQEIPFIDLVAESHPNLQGIIEEGIGSICTSNRNALCFYPMSGGFTSSKLFLFSADQKPYVLRVLDPKRLSNPALTFDKRMREVLTHRAAAPLGIAPEIVYSDPNGLILIMRYIDSHTLNSTDLDDEKFLLHLGSSLSRLHQTEIQLPEKRTQLDRVRKHYERAKGKGIAFPSNLESLYEEYFVEGKKLLGREVLCHGDLNPANILVQNGTPLFIDWAGATYDSLFTDLGYLTLLSAMNSEQTVLFLKGYFGRAPTSDELKRVQIAQARTCFITAIVWLDFSETPEDQKRPMQERVERLDDLLASSTLKTGFEYICDGSIVNPATASAQENQNVALGFLKEYLLRMEKLRSEERKCS